MALIDVITKRKKFTKVSLYALPALLLNQITELAISCDVSFFEVWEEEILETYVYDGVDARTIDETLYRQHYKDVGTETFFAVSFKDDNQSFRRSSKSDLEEIIVIDSSIKDPSKRSFNLRYGNEIDVSIKKKYFDFPLYELPWWLLQKAYGKDKVFDLRSKIK